MRRIIASVDLGSENIKLIVGEVKHEKINVLASVIEKSKGIKNGCIVNTDDLTISLNKAFKKVDTQLGVKVKKAIVSIPAIDIEYVVGEGNNTITNPDYIIKTSDIIRVLQSSVYNKIPKNKELVNLIPVYYTINENEKTLKPKNMHAKKLGVKSIITLTQKKMVYDIIKVFSNISVEVVDISLGNIGDYEIIKNDEIDKKVGVIINLGDQTTTISAFNKGVVTNSQIINLGSSNIDNDISFIYKVTKSQAKDLKENLSLGHRRMASANIYETLTNRLGEKIKINQYELTEIVVSRLEEILNIAKKQINLLTKHEISYIIFTGGSTNLEDINLLFEEIFGKNIKICKIDTIGVRNNVYSSALGLIKYFNKKLNLREKEFSIFNTEEVEELSTEPRKVNISSDSVLGKIFGYFFDN